MRGSKYNVHINAHGDKFWLLNGEIHREDGPAVEWEDDERHWLLNGALHRIDGPAITYGRGGLSDLDDEWYLKGIRLDRVYEIPLNFCYPLLPAFAIKSYLSFFEVHDDGCRLRWSLSVRRISLWGVK